MLILITVISFGCEKNETYKSSLEDRELFLMSMKKLTDVIVYDIFSPPVASRIYAYSSLAAYEAMLPGYAQKYASLAGQVNELTPAPKPNNDDVNFNLAAIHAFLRVGKAFTFSEEKIDSYIKELYTRLKDQGLPSSTFEASIEYGNAVADHVLAWASGDMYKETRTYPKYTIRQIDSLWKPTPPDYMEGIEPHWREIRTMVLDSAEQFPPKPPLKITMNESSQFFKELKEVYEVGVSLDGDRTEIAKFWDCNPYVSHHRGHAMFATKKITPGGHWIGICAIACRKAESTFDEAVETHARVSIALFDAFISCWDEKWRSLVVRPETLINQYMDEDWTPLLQTPPFPEYTSGHSVISRAAAVTLTDIYGDNFAFHDTTEVEYGLTSRNFNSFLEASEEAAISRLYGGIHYRMAIDNGVDQGEQVGEFIVESLETRKKESTAGMQ